MAPLAHALRRVSRRAAALLAWAVLACHAAFAAPAASSPADAPPAVVRYGVVAGLAPFQVWPEGSRPGGADVEIVRELATRAGLVLELVRYADYAGLEAGHQVGLTRSLISCADLRRMRRG